MFLNRENEDGSTLVTTAKAGHLVRSPEPGRYVLQLADGIQMRAGPDPADLKVLAFESLDVELALDDTVPPFRMRGEGERELTLTELWSRYDTPGPLGNGIRAEGMRSLASSPVRWTHRRSSRHQRRAPGRKPLSKGRVK